MLQRLTPVWLMVILFTLVAPAARAVVRIWTFEGSITQTISSLEGFEVGDPYSFRLTLDIDTPGTQLSQSTRYDTGVATFTSAENASDLVARIQISDAPGTMTIILEPPDTTLFQLELTNFPGEFRSPTRISILLLPGGAISEDLSDYSKIEVPSDPADRRLEIVFQGMGAILGSVDSVQTSVPTPTGAMPWLLLPALSWVGTRFVQWRSRRLKESPPPTPAGS